MEEINSERNNPFAALSQQIAGAVERVAPAIVAIDARPRVRTSGVIWRPGVVVSTNHTIRRDEEITLVLHDGREVKASLAGRDASTDLAVLRYEESEGGTPAQISDHAPKVGHLVLAVGRTDAERGVSASLGVVGLAAGTWRTWRGGEISQLIRPDVNIFIGFSGGALIDPEGRVYGLNTTGLARGAGLTIPAATVERVVDQLLQHGRVARPYLGVGMQPAALPEKLREKFNLRGTSGLITLSVEPDAPAEKGGVTIGDVLVEIDNTPVADTEDVQSILGGKKVGDTIVARILRGGELKELNIVLGERPKRKK